MYAKYQIFLSNASARLKEKPDCVAYGDTISQRLTQLSEHLSKAVAAAYENKFQALTENIRTLPEGKLSDEAYASALADLQVLTGFQPYARVPLLKVIGKDHAEPFVKGLSSVTKLTQALIAAFPKIQAMSKDVPDETFLVHVQLKELYTILNDQDTTSFAYKLAPCLEPAFTAVQKSISQGVAAWMSKMGATCARFLTEILKPEADLNAILKPEVVGVAELDAEDASSEGKDGKNEIDWCHVYGGFVQHDPRHQAEVLLEGSQKQKYHVSFLCAAGALLQLSKFSLALTQKVAISKSTAGFEGAFVGASKDGSKPPTFKMDVLVALHLCLPKYGKAVTAVEEIIGALGKLDPNAIEEVKTISANLQKKVAETIKMALCECNSEIESMQKMMQTLFLGIAERHHLPELFQAEKLERASMANLCNDHDSKQLLAVFAMVSWFSSFPFSRNLET